MTRQLVLCGNARQLPQLVEQFGAATTLADLLGVSAHGDPSRRPRPRGTS